MRLFKTLLLAAGLCLPAFPAHIAQFHGNLSFAPRLPFRSTPFAFADYSVVGFGGAACDGTTNDTTAFTNTYAQVMTTSGGRVLVPAGKVCRVENFFMDVTSAAESATPISLEADGGGRAGLVCQTCQVIVTIGTTVGGGTQWNNFHKQIKNIDFDLSQTNQTTIGGIYARDVLDMRLENVRVYNSNASQTGAKGIYIYGHGSHNCQSAGTTCHSSGNLLVQPYINGYFYVGIQIDGENTASNGNANQTTIISGEVLRPYGGNCSSVTTSTYGLLQRYADSLTIVNSNFEGFDHGMEFGGLNATVLGGRTECNNTGVYINDTTYPLHYHTRLVASTHGDGINVNGSNRVSKVDTYEGSWLKTNLENVRQVRSTTNLCTTTTTQYNKCSATLTFSPALPANTYGAVCTMSSTTGTPLIIRTFNKTTTTFDLEIMNIFIGSTATGKADCILTYDDGLGATVTP